MFAQLIQTLQTLMFRLQFPDEEGQDLAEYALILALIAIVVIVVVTTLGTTISSVFTNISGELSGI